ncbi:MAG: hypothetical protein MUQ32_15065, partial [Chloroflexi bacterium]|nr:hypothetical protein [Chloroflexota bacterium]
LGRGKWKGEWISVRALRRFAWTSGGALFVAVTPTAKAAPYAGVTIADAQLSMTSTTLDATWWLEAPRKWRFPGADVRATFEPADDPLLAAAESVPVTMAGEATAEAPTAPVASVAGKLLATTAALPTEAGAYRADVTLTDLRFGGIVASAEGVAVFVPGPRRAALSLHGGGEAIEAGRAITVSVSVRNTGTESWAERAGSAQTSAGPPPIRATRVVARWVPLDVPADVMAPASVELRTVPLAPGKATTVKADLLAPGSPGIWALVVDIVDDVDGSFAALGSAPAVGVYGVVVPRAIAGVE